MMRHHKPDTLRNTAAAALCACTLLGALAATDAQAATLSFKLPAHPLQPGQAFSVDLDVAGLTPNRPVVFFDVDVLFPTTGLSWGGTTLGSALGDIGLGQAANTSLPPDLGNGTLNMSVLSLLPDLGAQPASFTLGSIGFTALQPGTYTLDLGFVALEDMLGQLITVQAVQGTVSVVPEPASAWLLALGAAALAWRLRRSPGE